MISEYQNKIDEINLVLLRTQMIVPKWGHTDSICPPLGLAYVAATLKQSGYQVRCIDALGEAPLQKTVSENNKFMYFGLTTKEILQHLSAKKFNVLFVSLMFSHEWPLTKSLIKVIKKNYPNIIIVCGGEHISSCPEFCIEECPEIDICVLGEGEETSIDILKAIEQKKPFSKVNGIVYKSNNEIVRNPRRSRIRELDNIPLPAWDLFPVENYMSNGLGYGVNPGRTMPMLISRGCPYQCTFCSSPQMWTTKWQARDPDCVIEEMQLYIDKYKATNFDFYDLTTIVKKDWIVKFCQKVIKKNWNITWQMPSGTRSEALDDETLGLMKLSGQKHISYAPESASKTTLIKIKKKIKIENMKKSIKTAVSKGMSVKLNLMLGFPEETHKEVRETLAFVLHAAFMGVDDVYIASFAPYPGSELFDYLYKNKQITKLDDDYFLNLTSYSDLLNSYSYSKYVGHKMLAFYRLGGMSIFYFLSIIFRPQRIFRFISNFINKKEDSKIEKGIFQMINRFQRKKNLKRHS
jgi:radical SAM superfamily enzyme YgiQ (UPF0313 family)|tara:strand:+ start:144 stop:1706 length:1563 start_codon:yes stop_codon:yes gene_type:complete